MRVWPVETNPYDLAAFIDELADGPTQTYAAWKLAVNRSVLLELDAYMDYERRLNILTRETADTTEGHQAFRDKRPPRFTGR